MSRTRYNAGTDTEVMAPSSVLSAEYDLPVLLPTFRIVSFQADLRDRGDDARLPWTVEVGPFVFSRTWSTDFKMNGLTEAQRARTLIQITLMQNVIYEITGRLNYQIYPHIGSRTVIKDGVTTVLSFEEVHGMLGADPQEEGSIADQLFRFAEVPIRNSPIVGVTLEGILANAPVLAMYVGAQHEGWLLGMILVPTSVILFGAALGVSKGLHDGLRYKTMAALGVPIPEPIEQKRSSKKPKPE